MLFIYDASTIKFILMLDQDKYVRIIWQKGLVNIWNNKYLPLPTLELNYEKV